ncbi:MAG: ribonuclease III domain-containing protein [Candidatus Thermoplasmatota archaeon]|nr:ribonuclease III domain-containing protein [Candidatus Thermoplasmatota archaeon]
MSISELKSLEKKIGYHFNNTSLLKTALTHKTYAFEAMEPIEYNERLEFLGDSILNLIIAEKLYKTNAYYAEGELTRRRAQLVNNKRLAEKGIKLGIGKYLYLGKGEEQQNGRDNPTNLANAVEALLGAIYLDSDLLRVSEIIFKHIVDDII